MLSASSWDLQQWPELHPAAGRTLTTRQLPATLTYDAENQLTGVSGGASASFVYDGDGQRVKATFGTDTTVYVGNYFEWTGSTSTMVKYYYAHGQRIAMRVGSSTRYYLLTDHLGSTAITADSSGTRVAELRYKAWGENRYTYGTTPTAYKFTGQRLDESTGLMYYGARYYDPLLGRFVQADTIVPEPGNPQALNRYSYVLNNPLRYVDPTGYFTVDELVGWGVTHNQIREWQQEHPAWWAIIEEARLPDEVRALRRFARGGPRDWRGDFSICAGSLRLVEWNTDKAYDLETFRDLTKHHELWRRTGPGPTKWHPGVWEHVPTPTVFLSAYEPSQPPQGIDWGEVDGVTALLDITAVGLAVAGVLAEASPQGQGISSQLAGASLMVDLMSLARTEQQLREGNASQEDAMFELDTTMMGMTNPDPMTQLAVAWAQLVRDLSPSR